MQRIYDPFLTGATSLPSDVSAADPAALVAARIFKAYSEIAVRSSIATPGFSPDSAAPAERALQGQFAILLLISQRYRN